MNPIKIRILVSSISIASAIAARACDLCGCYTPQLEAQTPTRSWTTGLYAAIAEQFTHFATVQLDGREVGNPTGQRMESSITQLAAGYSFNKWLALQINVPLIYRSFKRPQGFVIDRGAESGVGDVSLLAKVVLFSQGITATKRIRSRWKIARFHRQRTGLYRVRFIASRGQISDRR